MKGKTKDLIVQTASELFYNKGYNLTGINEIIATAGIAKATLYSHFKSKEDLCIAYLEEKDRVLLDDLKKFCLQQPPGNKRLLAVLEFLLPFFESETFNGCWCIRTIAEIPRDNEKIRHTIRTNKKQLQNFIHSLVADNCPHLSKTRQDQLARRIYLLYESSVAESHLQENSWPIEENIDLLKHILTTS